MHCKEKILRVLSPKTSTFIYLWEIYIHIPTTGPPIFLQQNRRTDHGNIYINRSPKQECRNWKRVRAVSFLEMFFQIFGTVSLQCGYYLSCFICLQSLEKVVIWELTKICNSINGKWGTILVFYFDYCMQKFSVQHFFVNISYVFSCF